MYVYYPIVLDGRMPTNEATLHELLKKRRELAQDMPYGAPEPQAADFGEMSGSRDEIG